MDTHETMQVNNVIVETLDPTTLVSKLFDGSMPKKQRDKIMKSFKNYHKNLRNKPTKTLNDYRI